MRGWIEDEDARISVVRAKGRGLEADEHLAGRVRWTDIPQLAESSTLYPII